MKCTDATFTCRNPAANLGNLGELVQHRFPQGSGSGLTPHPVHYCQHLSVSNYSIKAQPVSGRRRRVMSMIAAGKGQRYEWSAGRNVQFTAVWDFHLSSAQRRRAGEGGEGKKKGEQEERGVKLLPPCSTSWTEYQLETAHGDGSVKAVCEGVHCSRSYQSPRMLPSFFHCTAVESCMFGVLPRHCLCFSSIGRYSISVSHPRFLCLSCCLSIRRHLANIHHWASLLCLRLNSIHPNICMLSNLQEEWNNLTKTNQSFINLLGHTGAPHPTPPASTLSEPSVVTHTEVKSTGMTLPVAGRANSIRPPPWKMKSCSQTKTLIHSTFFRSHGAGLVHPLNFIPSARLNKS